jgi:hypothetical protein
LVTFKHRTCFSMFALIWVEKSSSFKRNRKLIFPKEFMFQVNTFKFILLSFRCTGHLRRCFPLATCSADSIHGWGHLTKKKGAGVLRQVNKGGRLVWGSWRWCTNWHVKKHNYCRNKVCQNEESIWFNTNLCFFITHELLTELMLAYLISIPV